MSETGTFLLMTSKNSKSSVSETGTFLLMTSKNSKSSVSETGMFSVDDVYEFQVFSE